MTTWFVVPARGGSKGLPGKNLRTVGGASLVGRAIHTARMAIAIGDVPDGRVLVDTDDEAIAAEARSWHADVPFLRAPTLAADDTSSVDTVVGLMARMGTAVVDSDLLVLLQPTSPLRNAASILACIAAVRAGAPSSATVAPTAHPIGLALFTEQNGALTWANGADGDGRRRQDLSATHHLTGGVYVTTVGELRTANRFVVSGETQAVHVDAASAIDIDTAADLAFADAILRAATPAPVSIGLRQIGGDARCLVIAEAGVNHNGDVARAYGLIDAAANAGADVVKFQTFDPDALAAIDAPKARYQNAQKSSESQLQMLRGLTLPAHEWPALATYAADRGLLFLSTPFDSASADVLDHAGVPAFKVPSGELTNLTLIANLARRGKPLLVSTGMATLAEVGDALVTIAANGAPPVALFHCVSQYPAPLDQSNLAAIESLRATFNVPCGWSDHTPGALASILAVGFGASMIEKHITLDRTLPGPDHAASLEPQAFAALVRHVREAEAMHGTGIKQPAPCEQDTINVARRSLHAARDIPAGMAITPDDLTTLRPGTGLPPRMRDELIGRSLRFDVLRGTMLEEAHVG